MPYLIRLALRNLRRNRRRTFITASALALGVALLIFVNSMTTGFSELGFRNLVDFQTGEIQVHAPGYFDDREELPLEPLLPAAPALAAVDSVEGVAGAAPRALIGARLAAGWEEFPVLATGFDPERDGTVFRLAEAVEGRLPRPGALEAAVGYRLAELLEIGPGDVIVLVTRGRDNAFQALDLEVVGLLRTPHPELNRGHVYFPLDVADAQLALDGGVTELALRVEEGASPTAVAEAVRAALAAQGVGAEVFRWQESAADLVAMMQADAVANLILTGVILLIALVGVTNTILLGAIERRPEIGIMKALGMREGQIVLLFLLEATGIAILAWVAGSAVGALVNYWLVTYGFDFGAMFGDADFGIPVGGKVYGVWNGAIFLWAAVAGITTCWIAAYVPARRAARMDVAAAMRR